MNTVIVKINDATQTIAEHQVVTKDGQPTVIKTVSKVTYELVDSVTGVAPQHIVTMRVGDDLHISMDDMEKASDLVIKDYYDKADSALIGLAEEGNYYYFVPDSGDVSEFVTELEPGEFQGQALGGEVQSTPWWTGAIEEADNSFNALPWLAVLAGVGLVGAALAASDDGDDGAYSDTSNGENFGVDNFVDETTSVTGIQETAVLEMNAGQNIKLSNADDFAVSFAADDVIIQSGNVPAEPDARAVPADRSTLPAETVADAAPAEASDVVVAKQPAGLEAPPPSTDQSVVVELNPSDLNGTDTFNVNLSDMVEQGVETLFINGGPDTKIDFGNTGASETLSAGQLLDDSVTLGSSWTGTAEQLDRDGDGVADYNLWVNDADPSRQAFVDTNILDSNII